MRLVAWSLLAVLGSFAVGAEVAAGAASAGEAQRPSEPDLELLDAPIQEQYRQLSAALDAALVAGSSANERAAAWGALGNWYHAYDFYEGARTAYLAARDLEPSEPRWSYYLARIARATGDLETAVAGLRRVLELDPAQVAARVWLAESLWELSRLEEADREFAAALEDDPRSARALAGRAKVALSHGEPARAVGYLERALALQPGATSLRYALGSAYRQVGDLERSARVLAGVPADNRLHEPLALSDPWMDEVEALQGGHVRELVAGHRAFAAGRFREAADAFERAAAANPRSIDAWINLALAWKQAGEPAAAERAARQAVALHPEFARARVVLADLLLRQQRTEEARVELETAVAADPEDEVARFNLALLLLGQGRPAAAVEHFRHARRLMPQSIPARHGNAVALFGAGRAVDALAALEEDVAALPDATFLQLLLARFRATAPAASPAERTRAVSQARQLFASSPSISSAETLAMALAAVGDLSAAIAWQEAAVRSLPPGTPPASESIARARLARYASGQPATEPWAPAESMLAHPVRTPPTL